MVEEISSTKMYNKLLQHDKKLTEVVARLDKHEDVLADHSIQLQNLTEMVNRIDERTAFIPKTYDAMDAFMKEIREGREDRVFLAHRVSDHEERLVVVENALLDK